MINEISGSVDLDGKLCSEGGVTVGKARHPLSPLFYVQVGQTVYYSYDLPELFKLAGFKPLIDEDHIHKWLVGGPVRYNDGTLFRGVRRLYDNEYLYCKDGAVEAMGPPTFIYKPEKGRTMASHVAEVGAALIFACRRMKAESDGNILLGLSGGLDSRILACAMQKAGVYFNTFTYGFGQCFEENVIAGQVARCLRVPHEFYQISDIDYVQMARPAIRDSNGESLYKHGMHDIMYKIFGLTHDNVVFGSALDLLLGDSYPYAGSGSYFKSTWLFDRMRCKDMFKDPNYAHEVYAKAESDKLAAWGKLPKISSKADNMRAFVFETRVRRWYNANLIYPLRHMNVLLPTYDPEFLEAVAKVPYKYRGGDKFRVSLLNHLDDYGVGHINYNATMAPAYLPPSTADEFAELQKDIEKCKEHYWKYLATYIPSHRYEVDLKACYRLCPEFVELLLGAFEPLHFTLDENYLLKLLAEHVGGHVDHMRRLTQLVTAGLMFKYAQSVATNALEGV